MKKTILPLFQSFELLPTPLIHIMPKTIYTSPVTKPGAIAAPKLDRLVWIAQTGCVKLQLDLLRKWVYIWARDLWCLIAISTIFMFIVLNFNIIKMTNIKFDVIFEIFEIFCIIVFAVFVCWIKIVWYYETIYNTTCGYEMFRRKVYTCKWMEYV